MKCPRCSGVRDKVIQSRLSRDGSSIRRRRQCLNCGYRFTTYERIEEFTPVVIKKDGTRQAFMPEKIVSGIMKACEKRPVSMENIEAIRDSIIQEIQSGGEKEVSSSFVGEMVMKALHELDPVAYVRFASVYREFKDVDEFMDEIRHFIKNKNDI